MMTERGTMKIEDQRKSTGPLKTTERTRDYPSFGIGLPSVRHSPLPLQSFLPLVLPQPPLPLQEFWPLQACLSFLLLVAFLPLSELVSFLSPPVFWAKAVWPAINPVRAAPMSNKRTDFVMCKSPFLFRVLAESLSTLDKRLLKVRTAVQNGLVPLHLLSGG